MEDRNYEKSITCISSFTPKKSSKKVDIMLSSLAQNIPLSKNKYGIEKVKYSVNSPEENSNYNRPAIKTLSGSYCLFCKRMDGQFHKDSCDDPRENNLLLTVGGFARIIQNNNILNTKNSFISSNNVELINKWNNNTLNDNNRLAFPRLDKQNGQKKDFMSNLDGKTQLHRRDFIVKRGKKASNEKLNKTRMQSSYNNSLIMSIISSPDKPGQSYCDNNRSNIRISKNGKIEFFRIPYAESPMLEKSVFGKIKSTKVHTGKYLFDPKQISYISFKIEQVIFQNVELHLDDIKDNIEKLNNVKKVIAPPGKGFIKIEITTPNIHASVILYLKGKLMMDLKRPKNSKEVFLNPSEVFKLSEEIITQLKETVEESFNVDVKNMIVDKNTRHGNEPVGCRKSTHKNKMKESQRPTPYSFKGKCSESYQYLPPEGKLNKKDGLYYPCCSVLTNTKEKAYRKKLINGMKFPNPDNESGTLVHGSTQVGAISKVLIDGKWLKVKVCTRNKNGKLFTVSKGNKIFEVDRSQFRPESRSFTGLRNHLKKFTQKQIVKMLTKLNVIKTIDKALTKEVIPIFIQRDAIYKDYSINYISKKEVAAITSDYVVEQFNKPGGLPIKWIIVSGILYIIYGNMSMSFNLRSSTEPNNKGFGIIWPMSEPLQFRVLTQEKPFVGKVKVDGLRKMREKNVRSQNNETGIIDTLANINKGVAIIWKPKTKDIIVYNISPPDTPIIFQIIEKGSRPNHWIIGYDDTPFKMLKEVPIRGKFKVKSYYKAKPRFANGKISQYKPFLIDREVTSKPISRKGTIKYMKYLYSWPVVEKQVINWKNEWKIDLNRYHSF